MINPTTLNRLILIISDLRLLENISLVARVGPVAARGLKLLNIFHPPKGAGELNKPVKQTSEWVNLKQHLAGVDEPAGADANVDEGAEGDDVGHDAADDALARHERVDGGGGAAPEDGAEAVPVLADVVLQRLGQGLQDLRRSLNEDGME